LSQLIYLFLGKHDETCAKKLVCEFCPSRFHYWKTYAIHANKNPPDSVARVWKFCDRCKIFFPAESHRHFNDSDAPKDIGCKFCDETFKASKDHVQHSNAKHQDEIASTWIRCEKCGDYFPTGKGLIRHQKSFCPTLKSQKSKPEIGSRPQRLKSRRINYGVDNFEIDFDWTQKVTIEEENVNYQVR
jgi:uncharacterized C2H2 Zn-finger protein